MPAIADWSVFASKASFNEALKHFKVVKQLLAVAGKENLADQIWQLVEDGSLTSEQVPSIAAALLVDKLEYQARSINLTSDVRIGEDISESISRWTTVDLCCIYHDTAGNTIMFNPTNKAHVGNGFKMRKDELLVIYALDKASASASTAAHACDSFIRLIKGEAVSDISLFSRPFTAPPKPKAPEVTAVAAPKLPPAGKMQKSSQLGVVVSNELFHNGNVEAWTRILQSYYSKYPHATVNVYYDGEKITELASLFQWGKVKRGTCINYQVVAPDLKDMVKLKNYLYEGASERFEHFLNGPPHKVLKLF